jgi:hypothetical protein
VISEVICNRESPLPTWFVDTPDRERKVAAAERREAEREARRAAAVTKPKPKRSSAAGRFANINKILDDVGEEHGLSMSEVFVLVTLWRHERKGIARVSHERIAKTMRASGRTVIRAIAGLKAKKLIRVLKRGSKHSGISEYAIEPLLKVT